MPDMKPTVSVVVPLYETERYIGGALDSIRAQTFRDWEAIVVDDGSSDAGPAIARSHARADSRIKVIAQENRGLAGARNTGIRHSCGRYIALLDADDEWHCEKLARHVAHLDANATLGVSFSGSVLIDEFGNSLGRSQTPRLKDIDARLMLCRNPIGNGSAPVLRRSTLDEVEFSIDAAEGRRSCWFDESFRQSEDVELWLRIASSTAWSFEGVDGELTRYRVSTSGLSANVGRQLESWWRMRDKLACIAPDLVESTGAQAEGYQLRYLARRSALSGNGSVAMDLVMRSLAKHPGMLLEEPRRTVETLAFCGAAACLPTSAFDALKNSLLRP